MLHPTPHTPLALLFSLIRSYLAYLISIPAIVLHCMGILIGLLSIYAIGMAILPGVTASSTQALLTAINLAHFHYAGNPTPHFLKAYAIFGIVLAIIDHVLRKFFGVRIRLSWKQLFLALSGLTIINYTLAGIMLAFSNAFMLEPLAFLAILTMSTTALAIGAQKVLKK